MSSVANEVKPVRLQRSRRKGSKLVSPNGLPVVCVTRPGPWGNPWKVGVNQTEQGYEHTCASKASAVAMFEAWLDVTVSGKEISRNAKRELRGKNLACWCASGQACHADVLLRIANS